MNEAHNPAVTIDGPAGAGKTSLVRLVAERTGFAPVNTGAYYRAMARGVIDLGLDMHDVEQVLDKCHVRGDVDVDGSFSVSLNGTRVSMESLRDAAIDHVASVLSADPAIRRAATAAIRHTVRRSSVPCVLEGRDTGSVVIWDAELKFYLDADLVERARRRILQKEPLVGKIPQERLEAVAGAIAVRDKRDSERKADPLRQNPDMVYLDNTNLTLEETAAAVVAIMRTRFGDAN